MSKICVYSDSCRFAPDQTTTGGCPCAELCPGYCKDSRIEYSTHTVPGNMDYVCTDRTLDWKGEKPYGF